MPQESQNLPHCHGNRPTISLQGRPSPKQHVLALSVLLCVGLLARWSQPSRTQRQWQTCRVLPGTYRRRADMPAFRFTYRGWGPGHSAKEVLVARQQLPVRQGPVVTKGLPRMVNCISRLQVLCLLFNLPDKGFCIPCCSPRNPAPSLHLRQSRSARVPCHSVWSDSSARITCAQASFQASADPCIA